MISSNDVSALFAAQGQMFMGQQSYSNQIGVGPPPMPNMMQQGAQMGYQNSAFGPGIGGGNRFAGSVMSGIGGAASAVGAGVSMMGIAGAFGYGGMAGRMAAAIDPFAGASAGYGIAGRMGMGMAGRLATGAMVGAVPLAAGMIAAGGVNAFVQGGQQQQAIGNALNQNFQFPNAMARGGTGFTRDDATTIGNNIRSLAHVPEMMTSVKELTDLLPKMKTMGVMQGVKDAAEFSKRFKESVQTIRDVSKLLGTTMEEATKFFEHSRSVGFLGRKDQLKNTINSQFTASLTGMSMGQVSGLQQAGAGMALSMGARRDLGVTAVTNMAQSLGAAQQEGRIGAGALENITGLQGEDAVSAAAQRFTGMMAQTGMGTAAGRFIMYGASKLDDNGRAVLDEEIMARVKRGDISMDELRSRGMRSSNKLKLSFANRQEDLAMQFAGGIGAGGFSKFMEGITPDGERETTNRLIRMNTNASASEVDVMLDLSNQVDAGEQEKKRFMTSRVREAGIKERSDPKSIVERLKTRAHSALFGGLEQAGAKMSEDVGRAYDEVIDDFLDRTVASISKDGSKALATAFSGPTGKAKLKEIFENASGLKKVSKPGISLLSDEYTSGSMLQSVNMSELTGRTETGDYLARMRGLGFSGKGGAQEAGKAQEFIDALKNTGQSRDITQIGAKKVMADLAAEMGEEFEKAGDSRKLDMIRDKIKEEFGISGNHLSLTGMSEEEEMSLDGMRDGEKMVLEKQNVKIRRRNALLKGLKGLSKSVSFGTANLGEVAGRAYLSDTGSNRVDRLSGTMADAERASQTYQTVSEASEQIKERFKGLRDVGLDVGYASDNLENISKAMNNKGDVMDIIQSRNSPEVKIKALKKMGIEVKNAGEIDSLKKAMGVVSTGGGTKLIDDLKKFGNLSDAGLIARGFGNAASGIDTTGNFSSSSLKSLKESFTNLGDEGKYGQFESNYTKGNEALESYIREVMGEKDEKRRRELIDRGGVLGIAAEGGLSAPMIKGKTSVKDVMKRTGLSEEIVKPILAEGGIAGDMKGNITEDVMNKLRVEMGKVRGMGVLASESATQHASTGKDDKMLTTLDLIQKNISTSNTVMAAVAHAQSGDKNEAKRLLDSISGNINQSQ